MAPAPLGPALPLANDAARGCERADAARNRARILAVAAELVRERGIERVGMDDVARRAGVGTGTLYRRFGDRAGLALALLDAHERGFQEQLLRGDPPLGPGAAPGERLRAFGRAYLALVDERADLLAAASPRGPLVGGPFDLYRTHLRVLLLEAGFGGDVDYAVTSLMEVLSPRLVRYLRASAGWELERVQAGFEALVDGWLGAQRIPEANTEFGS